MAQDGFLDQGITCNARPRGGERASSGGGTRRSSRRGRRVRLRPRSPVARAFLDGLPSDRRRRTRSTGRRGVTSEKRTTGPIRCTPRCRWRGSTLRIRRSRWTGWSRPSRSREWSRSNRPRGWSRRRRPRGSTGGAPPQKDATRRAERHRAPACGQTEILRLHVTRSGPARMPLCRPCRRSCDYRPTPRVVTL